MIKWCDFKKKGVFYCDFRLEGNEFNVILTIKIGHKLIVLIFNVFVLFQGPVLLAVT